jgi:hypothetical protein
VRHIACRCWLGLTLSSPLLLVRSDKRRKEFSRRRPYYEAQDVDFINERNRVFNKKLKRHFDKYTTDIRTNLERGTA